MYYKQKKDKMKTFNFDTCSFVILIANFNKRVLTFWRNGCFSEYYHFFVLSLDIHSMNHQSK